MKELVILGGPNGAGKTTLVRGAPFRDLLNSVHFLNADDRLSNCSDNVAASVFWILRQKYFSFMRRLIIEIILTRNNLVSLD